jgi:hypothetical protein
MSKELRATDNGLAFQRELLKLRFTAGVKARTRISNERLELLIQALKAGALKVVHVPRDVEHHPHSQCVGRYHIDRKGSDSLLAVRYGASFFHLANLPQPDFSKRETHGHSAMGTTKTKGGHQQP